MERFLGEVRRACDEAEIEYHQVSTDDALDRVLLRFLSTGRGGRGGRGGGRGGRGARG
jgi:hypothetical protein